MRCSSKILFLVWDSLGGKHMAEALQKSGYEVVFFPFSKDEDAVRSEKLTLSLTEELIKGKYDYVFSFNYFVTAAMASKACKVVYVSWVYDSPCLSLYSETVRFETNRIFVFDSNECIKLQSLGVTTVHYLPLATNPDYYLQVIRDAQDIDRYDCDVAFVGAIKNESDEKFRSFENLDEYTKGYIEGIVSAQKNVYGFNFAEKLLTPEIMNEIRRIYPVRLGQDYYTTPEWLIANYYINQKVTGIERVEILKLLSEIVSVNLYTLMPTPYLEKVRNMGEVNYYTEAPLAFHCAKINLNVTLKSIVSGIPLRALDIMASGGFLITNYQADFMGLFNPDEDFVYYDSYEDLMSKTEYYLSHEKERHEIAQNGLEKIRKYHTYENRIGEMFK